MASMEISNNFTSQEVNILAFNTLDKILAYLFAIVIVLAFTGNTISFLIFRFDKSMKKVSSILILSFVVIIDNFAVINWNLNHFMGPNFEIYITSLNLYTCKIFLFIQYFSLQCSGLLLMLVIIDRYITISRTPGSFASKLPFCSLKYAFIWSTSIMIIVALLNFHILILNGYQELEHVYGNKTNAFNSSSYITIELTMKKKSFDCYRYSSGASFLPHWDRLNFILYSAVPSLTMLVLTTLMVIKTFKLEKSSNSISMKTFEKKRKITMSLVSVSIAYVLMTSPTTLFFSFIYDNIPLIPYGRYFDDFVDFLSFANHASTFFTSYFTNSKFRKCFYRFLNILLIKCIRKKVVLKENTQTSMNSFDI